MANTTAELLENGSKLIKNNVDSVFTKCKIISSSSPDYKVGQIVDFNLDFARKL